MRVASLDLRGMSLAADERRTSEDLRRHALEVAERATRVAANVARMNDLYLERLRGNRTGPEVPHQPRRGRT